MGSPQVGKEGKREGRREGGKELIMNAGISASDVWAGKKKSEKMSRGPVGQDGKWKMNR